MSLLQKNRVIISEIREFVKLGVNVGKAPKRIK
jgi:hypothetical protein